MSKFFNCTENLNQEIFRVEDQSYEFYEIVSFVFETPKKLFLVLNPNIEKKFINNVKKSITYYFKKRGYNIKILKKA